MSRLCVRARSTTSIGITACMGWGMGSWRGRTTNCMRHCCSAMPFRRLSTLSHAIRVSSWRTSSGGLSGAMGHYTDYLRPDDAVYPCNVVADRYQPGCYFYQTSHMMRVLNYDVEAVAELCADAPEPSRLHCFGSFGRDVATVVFDDPASAIAYCRYATTDAQETECLAGAVQNGFWDPNGAERAAEFCRLLSEDPEIYRGVQGPLLSGHCDPRAGCVSLRSRPRPVLRRSPHRPSRFLRPAMTPPGGGLSRPVPGNARVSAGRAVGSVTDCPRASATENSAERVGLRWPCSRVDTYLLSVGARFGC